MNKLKSTFKKTLSYIVARRSLRYSAIIIIIIMVLLPTVYILNNKYFDNKKNTIEKVEDDLKNLNSKDKNITKGTINTDAVLDKEISKHTLKGGFSTLSENSSSSNNSSNSSSSNKVSPNISQNTSININKSSINGIDLEILEGAEFNAKKDLKLKATDEDGSNISDRIIIEKNNVNTTVPGIYTVKASVKLSNGQSKEKEFTVTVKETRLDISLESFKTAKQNIKKGEKIGFEVDFKVSKNHIKPIAVMLNGQEQPLYEGNQNIINRLINKKNYKLFVDASNTAGEYEYNLEYVKMSNGSWISLGQNITTINVLKQEASINSFNYKEESENKKVNITFNLEDLDNSASNIRLELSKDDNLLEKINLDKMVNYSIDLSINSNGIYNLKILSDINLNQNISEESILLNKEIFSTKIRVSYIDQTSITGNDIEITKGQDFDAVRDLNLKAIDSDGEDITSKIEVNNQDIDVNKLGQQIIAASITNKNGKICTKEFKVTVKEVDKNEFSLARILSRNLFNNRSISLKSNTTTSLTGNDTQTLTQNVKIDGVVSKSDGTIPSGRIQVELPTAMSFSVDQDGNFISADYTINNKSSVPISVYVSEFRDSNNGGIKVKEIEEDISNLDRSNLHLALIGNDNKYVDLGKIITIPKLLLTINPQSSSLVQLLGEAGKGSVVDVDEHGVSDEFTLVFRIKKS
ncbi:MAG: hypothetical protein ACLRSF_00955 [Romboutsia timonensis]|uniref:hypothetical protein n=1 Tax=Romboutsia timonensis TaxID=1776391 RepID=UPI0039906E34